MGRWRISYDLSKVDHEDENPIIVDVVKRNVCQITEEAVGRVDIAFC